MKIILLSVLLMSLTQAAQVDVKSDIDSVTVFNDRAFVTRQFRQKLTKGAHSLTLKNLPTSILQDSFKVKTAGDENVRVLGLRIKKIETEKTNNKELNSLLAMRNKNNEQRELIIKRVDKIISQYNNLKEVKELYQKSFPVNLQTKKWSKKSFSSFNDYLVNKNLGFVDQWKKEYSKIITNYDELEYLNSQISELNSTNKVSSLSVSIDVEVLKTTNYDLSLQYLIPGAGWEPSYDIRIQSKKSLASISQYALVWQSTGEDWTKSSIILSNRRSKLKTNPPSISGYTLNYKEVDKVKTTIKSKMDDASDLSTHGDQTDKEELKFYVSGVQTILSGRPKTRVFIKSKTMPYKESLELVARKYDHVYKSAQLINKFSWALQPGLAYIYYDEDFIQTFNMEKVPSSKSFRINAGIDYDIKVDTWHNSKNEDKGIIKSKKIYKREFLTKLRNFSSIKKKVNVLVQFPVSETKEIDISLDGSTEELKKLDAYPSWGSWNVELDKDSTQTMSLKVAVEAPKDFNFTWN